MKRIFFTKKAKKDLKRIRKDAKKVDLLSEVLFKLAGARCWMPVTMSIR